MFRNSEDRMDRPNHMKKSDETRQLLVDTAFELFSRHGYEKTTIRAIANTAEVALGTTYYHFSTKDEIILSYYERSARDAREKNAEIIAAHRSFENRFRAIIEFRFAQLKEHRKLLKVLAKYAGDFQSPLSPFSAQSKPMREEAIAVLEELIEAGGFNCGKHLQSYAASLLWIYQMVITLFWANDETKGQKRTGELLAISLPLLTRLFALSRLPLMSPLNRTVVKMAEIIAPKQKYEA